MKRRIEANADKTTPEKLLNLAKLSQAQELKELKELSLPTVAEELRQQSFWRSFLSSKTYVLTP